MAQVNPLFSSQRFPKHLYLKERIPKGLRLKFNLELVKDNANLQDACTTHLRAASANVVKELKEATFVKVKVLQKDLQHERTKLCEQLESEKADKIWNLVRNGEIKARIEEQGKE